MIRIKTPASTSNLGFGFDTLGLAFELYNTFEVEESSETKLFNIDDAYNNDDNLFLVAYRKVYESFGTPKNIHVHFQCDVPNSRGLGSSASFIVAGILAAYALEGKELNRDEIFSLACELEGHPDNVAPCIFGGLSASYITSDHQFLHESLKLSDKWYFTCLIPDYEINTHEARNALPSQYDKSDVIQSPAKAILLAKALEDGNLNLIHELGDDVIHEPYRKELMHEFNELDNILSHNMDGKLFISGSGSTCLWLSLEPFNTDINLSSLTHAWKALTVQPNQNGFSLEVSHE